MNRSLRLMAVLAHPDDESLGFGPTLARYAAEGVETSLVMATLGQKGWKLGEHPGPEAVAARRRGELERAAEALGLSHLTILDHLDGELDRVAPQVVIAEIASAIRRRRPDVVLTFGLEGAYGHPDHIAIAQLTTAAILTAAASHEPLAGLDPHRVSKLYHLADTEELIAAYAAAFGAPTLRVDGEVRTFRGWEAWYPSARIDARAHVATVRAAILEHRSQLRGYEALLALPDAAWSEIFGEQAFARVFSLVNGGRAVERDLFAGLRPAPEPIESEPAPAAA